MICCLKNQLSESINFTSFQKPFKTHPNVCATLPNDVYKNCMHMGRVSSDKPQPLFNSFLSWKKTMNGLFCITINQSWFWWQQDSCLSRGNRKHQTTTMIQLTEANLQKTPPLNCWKILRMDFLTKTILSFFFKPNYNCVFIKTWYHRYEATGPILSRAYFGFTLWDEPFAYSLVQVY